VGYIGVIAFTNIVGVTMEDDAVEFSIVNVATTAVLDGVHIGMSVVPVSIAFITAIVDSVASVGDSIDIVSS